MEIGDQTPRDPGVMRKRSGGRVRWRSRGSAVESRVTWIFKVLTLMGVFYTASLAVSELVDGNTIQAGLAMVISLTMVIILTLQLLREDVRRANTSSPTPDKYVYLVTYSIPNGNGNIEVTREYPITHMNDVYQLQRDIRRKHDIAGNVIISGLTLLRTETTADR